MKKLLLTAAAVSILSTSSAYAASDFYVKANVGWSKLVDAKIEASLGTPELTLKSKNDIHVGVGAGYHLQNDVRVEIMLDHYIVNYIEIELFLKKKEMALCRSSI